MARSPQLFDANRNHSRAAETRDPGRVLAGTERPARVVVCKLDRDACALAGLHERLVAAGVSFVSPPVEVDTGINAGGYGLYLRDPDGIMVELFQPPAPRA